MWETLVNKTTNALTHYNIYSKLVAPLPLKEYRHAAVCGISQVPALIAKSDSTRGEQGININPFSAGVAGVSDYGIGVYGAVGSGLPTDWIACTYAGFFDGNVRVIGNITTALLLNTSDQRLKTNIASLSNSHKQNLLSLSSVSFTYKNDTVQITTEDGDGAPMQTRKHYGLLAQQVQTLFPDLVYEDERGYLSVNYIELIPIMIEHIKDLTERVEALESNQISSEESAQRVKPAEMDNSNIVPVLMQNNPNPFNRSTTIGYILPEQTQEAAIYIYDMNGTQIAGYPVTVMGEGKLEIADNSLPAGMYLYSLIADNEVVDTKRMILTK